MYINRTPPALTQLGEGRPFLHAHSFHDEGEARANDSGARVVDLGDTAAKCAIDLLPPQVRPRAFIQSTYAYDAPGLL